MPSPIRPEPALPRLCGLRALATALCVSLAMALPSGAIAQSRDVLACLEQAGSPLDTELPAGIAGVGYDRIDRATALPVCQAAATGMLEQPDDTPLAGSVFAALGRVLHQQEPATALRWYQEAVERGSGVAAYNAGIIHRDGAPGIPQSYDRAGQMFGTGWSLGFVNAGYELALLQRAGRLPGAGRAEALALMQAVAETGNAFAHRWLAIELQQSGGTGPDWAAVARHYTWLADNGDSAALLELANLVGRGTIAETDEDRELALMQRAAAVGDGMVHHYLSLLLAERGDHTGALAAAYRAWDTFDTVPLARRDGFPSNVRQIARNIADLVARDGISPRDQTEFEMLRAYYVGSRTLRLMAPVTCGGTPQRYAIDIWNAITPSNHAEMYSAWYRGFAGCSLDRGFIERLNTVRVRRDRSLGFLDAVSRHLDRDGAWNPGEALDEPQQRRTLPSTDIRRIDPVDDRRRIAMIWPNMARPALQDIRVRRALASLAATPRELGFSGTGTPERFISTFESQRHTTDFRYILSDTETRILAPLQVPRGLYAATLPLPLLNKSEERALELARMFLATAGFDQPDVAGLRLDPDGEPFGLTILGAPAADPLQKAAEADYSRRLGALGISHRLVPSADMAGYRALRAQGDWDLAFDFDARPGRFMARLSDRLHLARAQGRPETEIAKMIAEPDVTFGRHDYIGLSDPAVESLLDHLVAARNAEQWDSALRALSRLSVHALYGFPLWVTSEPPENAVAQKKLSVAELQSRIAAHGKSETCGPWSLSWHTETSVKRVRVALDPSGVTWRHNPDVAFDLVHATGEVRDRNQSLRDLRFETVLRDEAPDQIALRLGHPTFFVEGRFSDAADSHPVTVALRRGAESTFGSAGTRQFGGPISVRLNPRLLRAVLDAESPENTLGITLSAAEIPVSSYVIPVGGLVACLDIMNRTIDEIYR